MTEVNAARGQTPQPDWRQIYSHIVVGEVPNRGYTLEGLTSPAVVGFAWIESWLHA
jgi:hypothetical protein